MSIEILKQIRKPGAGFINPLAPMANIITKLNSVSLNDMYTLADQQFLDNQAIPRASNTSIGAAFNSIILASNSVNNMLGHSNRISGVNMTGDSNLAVIARTMSAARNSDGTKSCDSVLSAFGSIQKAADIISEATRMITEYERYIKNINGLVNSIPSLFDAYVMKLESQILSDVNALAIAQIKLMETAVANTLIDMFNDECTGKVISAVMSNELKTTVNNVILKKKRQLLK